MDVKPGYKRTEVGLIPEDWEVRPLRRLASIRTGIAKNAAVVPASPIRVHLLRVANVQDGYLDLSDMVSIAIERRDLQRYGLQPGDVLMNEGGDLDKLGRGTVWSGAIDPCVHQNHVFAVRCGAELVPDFLDAWSATTQARRYFLTAGKQTTNLASVNKTALGGLPVVVPPKPEQESIAGVLRDADALIDSLERILAKKRQLKQAVMHDLLTGKIRLPGFSGDLKSVPLSTLVESWIGGNTPSMANPEYWSAEGGGGIPWVASSDVIGSRVATTRLALSGEAVRSGAASVVPARSILVVTRSGILRRHLPCAMNMVPMAINQDIRALVPRSGVVPEFLLYVFGWRQREILARCLKSGTTVESLELRWLKSFEVPAPEASEQLAIAEAIESLENHIRRHEVLLAKVREVGTGLGQALLSGRKRLPEWENAGA